MIIAALTLGLAIGNSPRNLLVNGDFSRGRRGFTTYYGFASSLFGDGTCWVGDDPAKMHPMAAHIHDHTSGRGMMFCLNGSGSPQLPFWSETVTVEPNHRYHFAGYATSWATNPSDGTETDSSPARIVVMINGQAVGPAFQVSAHSGDWGRFGVSWTSGAGTTARITLYDDNTDIQGNDFAVDDLSFFAE